MGIDWKIVIIFSLFLTGCTSLNYTFDEGYQNCTAASNKSFCTKSACLWSSQAKCFYELAQEYEDASICNEVIRRTLYGGPFIGDSKCAKKIAISTDDVSQCQLLNDKNQVASCITGYAIEKSDSHYCDYIPEDFDKAQCQENFS